MGKGLGRGQILQRQMQEEKGGKMRRATLVFPHQLFEDHPALSKGSQVFLIEEHLFFKQYRFHKQKLRFHRASMKFYERHLLAQGFVVEYIESTDSRSDVRDLLRELKRKGIGEISFCEVADNWLDKRIRATAVGVSLKIFASPAFLNSVEEIESYFGKKKRYFQTDFYITQRKKLGILIEPDFSPVGGKWSFDAENRKRYPKGRTPPAVRFPDNTDFDDEARGYVESNFPTNPGKMPHDFKYPATFDESQDWLSDFLTSRFAEFGGFEDAIVASERILNHSLLSPLMNAGLLTPADVVGQTLEYTRVNEIPINSAEGFFRQIIGWREFVRGVYQIAGTAERTRNYWGFERKLPQSFWNGTTGVGPVDEVILKVLETGYCHHIERLMVLGNFMLLCEFDPDDVYRWFMEMFIDAYDWVMVPNVYGMSQFADGGLFATKPYISGSNYLGKMGDFTKGPWQGVWDGLFWRFMDVHRGFFIKNPRLSMLVRTFDKMAPEKRAAHLEGAGRFLESL